MCGIAGIVDFNGNVIAESLVKSMCTAICHRGPDDEGVLSIPAVPASDRKSTRLNSSH